MDKMSKDLDAFEAKLGSALRATGHLFPTTDREVEYFFEHAKPVSVPEKYKTPDFIFQDETHASVERTNVMKVDFSGTAQSWALAARNGRDLPQSILDKMKEDKKNSQKK
jgi:hypothetical protein